MTPLEQLIARTEITELKARYCRLLDTKQWDAWAELFTADITVDVSDDVTPEMGTPILRGRDLFVGQTRELIHPSQSVHQVHTLELSFKDDDHAEGIWAMYDHIQFAAGGSAPFKSMTAHGFYHERYVRTASGWKIAALRLERTARTIIPRD